MSHRQTDAPAGTAARDLAVLLRINEGASTSIGAHRRGVSQPLAVDSAGRRRRDLGLLIGFPLALMLGVVMFGDLRGDGSLAAKRDPGERLQTPPGGRRAIALTFPTSPVRETPVAGPSIDAVIVRNVPAAYPIPDHPPRSKTANRTERADVATPVVSPRERASFEVAEDTSKAHPGDESREEPMVDLAKVRSVTRTEAIDDIRFLKLQ